MAVAWCAHPLLGVGLGNWAVQYPRYIDRDDEEYPWYRAHPRNRMASSDLLTLGAEGGVPLLVLVVVIGCLALGRPIASDNTEDAEQLRWTAAAATLTVIGVLGAIDNVVLVQPTSYLASAAIGSFAARPWTSIHVVGSRSLRWTRVAIMAAVGSTCIARLAVQNAVAWAYAAGATPERLEGLAKLDRGEYWLHMTLAFAWHDRGRCDLARLHATSAARLYPFVAEPRIIEAVCATERAPACGQQGASILSDEKCQESKWVR